MLRIPTVFKLPPVHILDVKRWFVVPYILLVINDLVITDCVGIVDVSVGSKLGSSGHCLVSY